MLIVRSPETRRDPSSLARSVSAAAVSRLQGALALQCGGGRSCRHSHTATLSSCKARQPQGAAGALQKQTQAQITEKIRPVLKGVRSSPRSRLRRLSPAPQQNNCVTRGCQHSLVSTSDSSSKCLTRASS